MSILSISEIISQVRSEEQLANAVLHLTANETALSPVVRSVLSTSLYSRYFLEHHTMRGPRTSRLGNFIFRGLDHIAAIEASAVSVCSELFSANYVEFRCLSGIHAMETTIASLTRPGDSVMRIATKDGGHFLTETICRLFGRKSCAFVFKQDNHELDIEATAKVIEEERPVILYLDAMNYLFPFPVRDLRNVAGNVPIVYDASHTLGLIAGGQFQNPLREGADILQANTHKTFFGPQKGIILSNNEALMERITYALSNALVSSQNTAGSLALYLALHEMYYYGKEYASKTIENAQFLAQALFDGGLPVLESARGFTSVHQLFVDLRQFGPGPVIMDRLVRANISANRMIAFKHIDTLRLGVQEITRYGYNKNDLRQIADLLVRLLLHNEDPEHIRPQVISLVQSYQTVQYYDSDAWRADQAEHRSTEGDNQSNQRSAEHKNTPPGVDDTTPVVLPDLDSCRWINVQLDQKSIVDEMPQSMFRAICEMGQLIGGVEGQLDSAGNLSFLKDGNIFVTAAGVFIRKLTEDDFVKIEALRGNTLICKGLATPATESLMHYLAYEVTDAQVIVHFHHVTAPLLMPSDVAFTGPHEYGSRALAEGVATALSKASIVYIRTHGFVITGVNMSTCRATLVRLLSSLGWKLPQSLV